jgi:phage terminase large subunit-like protein
MKQNSSTAWLSAQTVSKCCGEALRLEDFRSCYCIGGIDLSRTTSLTSCCVVIEKNETLYVFSQFFLPSEKIDEATARDGVPYKAYIQRGFLTPSGENVVDYNDCYRWFTELVERYEILPLKIGYDRYNSLYLTNQMKQYGFHMDDVYQGFNLSPCISELEGLLKDGKIDIGDNDLLKIHLLDSALKTDVETNRSRLVKLSNNSHIDGTASLLDAITVRQKWYSEIGEQLANKTR